MQLLLGLVVLCAALLHVSAVYESQAGVIDWHHTWVGKPLWIGNYDSDRVPRLLVSTERNVLASLNFATGSLQWRQQLDHAIATPQWTESGALTVANTGDAVVQHWDVRSGALLWQHTFDSSESSGNVVRVLNDGKHAVVAFGLGMAQIELATGQITWTTLVDGGHACHALHQADNVIYAACSSIADKPILHLTGFDIASGKIVAKQSTLASSGHNNVLLQGEWLVWTEGATIKWKQMGSGRSYSAAAKSTLGPAASFQGAALDHIKLQQGDGSNLVISALVALEDQEAMAVAVISLDKASLTVKQDLGLWPSIGASAVVSGASGDDASLMHIGIRSTDMLTMHEIGENVAKHDLLFSDAELVGGVDLAHVATLDDPLQPRTTLFFVSASGSLYAYDITKQSILWSREEALAHTSDAVWVDLPEKQTWTKVDEEEEEHEEEQGMSVIASRYWRRLATHAAALHELPVWLVHHVLGMASTSSTKANDLDKWQSQQCWSRDDVSTMEWLQRDSFGIRKLIVSVTSTGKIIAQDTGRHGKIVWTRVMHGVQLKQVFVVRAAANKLAPVLVAVGFSDNGETTHLFRLDGWTGQDYVAQHSSPDAFDPEVVTATGIDKIMLLPVEESEEHTRLLALYDAATTRTYIYPDSENARTAAAALWPSFYFQFPKTKGKSQEWRGFVVKEGYRGSLTAEPVWRWALPASEQLVATAAPAHGDKIASIGRVLGNRNVYYKYINPNLMTVASIHPERNTLAIRLVDAVTGAVLYDVTHDHVPIAANDSVHIVQAENWVVYTFWSNDGPRTGFQVVVLELFEGIDQNERHKGVNFTSYDGIQPHVQAASFAFPYAVRAMGISRTRNGVTTKDILFATKANQIVAVNKRYLDPRRPEGKPTPEDQEEGLFPYAPIPEERKMILTYNLEVLGIDKIIASPAQLESTSLVFAFGLDAYMTRVSPSRQFDVLSEAFNKSQLLLTIVALSVGVIMTGPIVRRKQVNALWK
ncbi:hypothetical protein BC940DRAFT_305397 [Gongronella butleri]|nr:hypothetical protein BC940DRAFT_305397 [Gongronella butleri]